MKPAHPMSRALQRDPSSQPRHPKPLTDYFYRASSFGGGHFDGERDAPKASNRPAEARADSERESRACFVGEAVLFALLLVIAVISLALCAHGLWDFLHALT